MDPIVGAKPPRVVRRVRIFLPTDLYTLYGLQRDLYTPYMPLQGDLYGSLCIFTPKHRETVRGSPRH